MENDLNTHTHIYICVCMYIFRYINTYIYDLSIYMYMYLNIYVCIRSTYITKPGFSSTWTVKFQMFKLDLEKAEEPEIKSLKKQESFRKTSISALLTMPKPLTVWITTNCGKYICMCVCVHIYIYIYINI